MQIDDRKVSAIKNAPIHKTVKQVSRFVGQVKWHNRYLRYLSHVCYPLTKLTKRKQSICGEMNRTELFSAMASESTEDTSR